MRARWRVGCASAVDGTASTWRIWRWQCPTCRWTDPRLVVGGDDGLRGKPGRRHLSEAARRLFAPAQCVVFEDAPFGIGPRGALACARWRCTTTFADSAFAGP